MEADITSQAVGLGANTDFSLMSLFLRADIIVKSVMIILIVCSIYSWAVIIEKFNGSLEFSFAKKIGVRIFAKIKAIRPKEKTFRAIEEL